MKDLLHPENPHRSIIWIRTETQELLPNGECNGISLYQTEYPIHFIDGITGQEAFEKATDYLKRLKENVKELK